MVPLFPHPLHLRPQFLCWIIVNKQPYAFIILTPDPGGLGDSDDYRFIPLLLTHTHLHQPSLGLKLVLLGSVFLPLTTPPHPAAPQAERHLYYLFP